VGGSFKPGGEFTLTALVSNPQRNESLSLELPAGVELVGGEATQKGPEVPADAGRRASPRTWKSKAGAESRPPPLGEAGAGGVPVGGGAGGGGGRGAGGAPGRAGFLGGGGGGGGCAPAGPQPPGGASPPPLAGNRPARPEAETGSSRAGQTLKSPALASFSL